MTNERARYGKESYLKALQKNKQKIEDVLENRPTLLHRYDEASITSYMATKIHIHIEHTLTMCLYNIFYYYYYYYIGCSTTSR